MTPLLVIGNGYIDSSKYRGWSMQAEYKSDRYIWRGVRPQATFLLTDYGAGYGGFGLGWEFYLSKHFMLIPSFCPVIYWRGNGKDLGCPVEFRSCIEIAYETKKKMRFGFQIFHVSNANISDRNPGFNAFTFCIGFPLH